MDRVNIWLKAGRGNAALMGAGFLLIAAVLCLLLFSTKQKSTGEESKAAAAPGQRDHASVQRTASDSREKAWSASRVSRPYFGFKIELDPKESERLLKNYIASKDNSKLAALYAITGSDSSKDALMGIADQSAEACEILALRASSPEDKEKWATQALELNPQSTNARLCLAGISQKEGNIQAVDAMLDELAAAPPDNSLFQNQAKVWQDAGESAVEAKMIVAGASSSIKLLEFAGTIYRGRLEAANSAGEKERILSLAEKMSDNLSDAIGSRYSLQSERAVLAENRRLLEAAGQDSQAMDENLEDLQTSEREVRDTLSTGTPALYKEYLSTLEKEGWRGAATWLNGTPNNIRH